MNVLRLVLVGLLYCLSGVSFSQETIDPRTSEPILIGDRIEPLWDNHLIDSMNGVSLKLHEPVPRETVFKFDKPWEGRYCGYVTVIQDGALYRMYYRGMPQAGSDGSIGEFTCYAESRDGVRWVRPDLGIHEIQGKKNNNAVLANAVPFSHNFAPSLDERPGVPANERYKALAGTSTTGLVAFVSADGLHWSKLREEPVITKGMFDSQNVAFWSESEQCYVCYFRTFTKVGYEGFRTVTRTTSLDFLNWTEPVQMSFGDTPIEHLYTNQTVPYFRAPHVYVALAARFMPGRRVVPAELAATLGGEEKYSGDCSDAVFMTTRGGNSYDRTFMEGFVRPGLGLENWTSRTNYPARGIVPTGTDEISFYIQRRYGQLDHSLQRMTLRTDGFASVHAPYAGGGWTTKMLIFEGKELRLNVATSAAGGVKVEVIDEVGAVVPGYSLDDCLEIIGDEIDRTVHWKSGSDLSAFAGKSIRLRFAMKDADVYSLRFQ